MRQAIFGRLPEGLGDGHGECGEGFAKKPRQTAGRKPRHGWANVRVVPPEVGRRPAPRFPPISGHIDDKISERRSSLKLGRNVSGRAGRTIIS